MLEKGLALGFSETHVARFAVDGGITTGLCWGVFPKKGDMEEQVRRARKGGSLTFEQITPSGPHAADFPELSVALKIYDLWFDWNEALMEKGLYPTRVIIEDFRIRTQVMTRSVLSSVRICNLLLGMMTITEDEGMEFLHLPTMYDPSQSKRFATNERLKRWGLWAVGMDHARDAARLLALDLAEERNKGR